MSKQKRKLKKNQVQVDSKIYDVNSPSYAQMYEDKFEGGDVVWDNLLEEWVSVPKGMNDAWDELYKNQRVGKVQDKVRKGTGDFAKGVAQGAGTMLGYTGEAMNTPLALLGEYLSGRNDYYSALPNMSRVMTDMGLESQLRPEDQYWLPNNDQLTPGALVSDNPLIQMGVDIPLDILTGKGFKTLTKSPKTLKNIQKALTKNQLPEQFQNASQAGFSSSFSKIPDEITNEGNLTIKKTFGKNTSVPENINIEGKSGSWQLKKNNAGENVWYFSANMTNPVESGRTAMKMNELFPLANPSILEPNSLSLDSYDLLLNMGKRPHWSMNFENYIPLNYSHKHSDLIKDLGLSAKDETYRLMSQETADEIANRINDMLLKKGIEQKARTFQIGDYKGIEVPNFKLTRDYQTGGMIKRKDGSYSQRGLWDNIRANKGSGKKPTKEMLAQEKKIKKKMAVGGEVKPNPVDPPNYKDRLQQFLSLSPEYRNMFTARSPLEYGLSTNGLDAGMYFNPMTNMPGMYGALNLNKKGFNLGAEKRIGLGENTTDLNAGYGNDKFNVSGNLKRGTQGNEFGFSAGYNTPNLNIGASYFNVGGMPNVNANVGFNKNNFRGGLGYEYSGGNRLTGNVGYSKDAYDVGVSGMYSPTDSNINANLNYKLGTRKKQKTEPINIKSDKNPQEIKLINDDEVSSGEAAFPNMKNNKIPKLGFGATLAPMLFDVASNALMNLSTKAVTDMVKAIREPEPEIRPTKPNTGFTMAYGGMIDPSMYMQQMMYGSYAQGGQVPQNIPVEVEGEEMYEMPNGQVGKFQGPTHEEGGIIPVVNGKKGLPEGTKVYSDRLKVNGKTMADRKDKRERNIAKLEKLLGKSPHDKFLRQSLERQKETAALEEQSDMAMQEQANQQQAQQEQAVMQEQAMAGLMQDPAMMQQMGMMMYGGKLNKLANGGEPTPINPLPIKQIYDLRYPNKTIDIPYNERFGGMYNNKPFTQEMFPLNNNIPNPFSPYNPFTPEEWEIMTNTEFIEGEGYPLTGHNINSSFTNPDELNKFYDAKLKNVNTLSRKSSLVPTVKNNYLEEMADLAQRASGGRGTSFTYYPNDYDGRDKQYPYVVTFGGKSMTSNTNKAKPITTNNIDSEIIDSNVTIPDVDETSKAANLNWRLNNLPKLNANIQDVNETIPSGGVNPLIALAEEERKKYRNEDDVMTEEIRKKLNPNTNPYNVMNDIMGNTFGNIALSKDPYINSKGVLIPNPFYNEAIANKLMPNEDPKKPNKFMNFLNKAVDETGDFFSGLFDKNGKPKKEKGTKLDKTKSSEGLDFTRGDLMGLAGNLFGGVGPMMGTFLNRMETPKNVNFFREFGAEGLRAMQEAQALAAINRDKQLGDIKLGEEASRQRGRNSARGVNTLRALDIAADMGANQAQNQAYNAYAQQMMQLLGQKAQMENQQDQMVMQGETARDLADRQDIDNFYTNLTQNLASQSELMQKTGRDLNVAQRNRDILKLAPMYSQYGIGIEFNEKTGTWDYTYNNKKVSDEKVKEIMTEQEKKKNESVTTTPVIPTKTEEVKANNALVFPSYLDYKFPTLPTMTDEYLLGNMIPSRKYVNQKKKGK